MGYICTKACRFGGIAYQKGDPIPTGSILPSRQRVLIAQGYIAVSTDPVPLQIKEEEQPAEPLKIFIDALMVPIKTSEGILELNMPSVDVINAISIMQLGVEDAVKIVAEIASEDMLILIDSADSRKTIKAAVEKRAAILKSGSSATAQEDKVDPPASAGDG